MPRKATANDLIRDTRRREILRAAARVFAERGIREATVSDIAHAAGLSHGLIYHYFTSKDAVLEAIVDDQLESMGRVIVESQTAEIPILERISRSFEAWMARVAAEPDLALVITQAVVNRALPEPLRQRLASAIGAAYEQTVELIRLGQASGEITDEAPAEELATAMVAMMRGLTLFHEVRLVPVRPVPHVEVMMRMLRPLPANAPSPKRSAARRPKEPR